MNKIMDLLDEIYGEQTSKCSEVSRKIVFALFAIVWAISFSNGKLTFSVYSVVVTFLIVLFLLIDTYQYFVTAIRYRKHFYGIKDAIDKRLTKEKVEEKELEKRKEINDKSFKTMVVKIALLPFIFLGILLALVDMLLHQS